MMKLLKKSLSFTIVLAMLITMMPATVWAAVDSTGKPTDLANDIVLSIYTQEGEFPGEPAVYGTSNYKSFKSDFTLASTSFLSNVIFKDSAEDELKKSILDALVEGTPSGNTTVWGAYDAKGMKEYFLENASITNRENEKKMICAIKNISETDAENYEIIWYVIKLQHSSGWFGRTEWHIDGVIKEKSEISINYYGNGNTSGEAPLGKTNHKSGDPYTVLGQNTMIKKIGGVEVGFLGWSAKADGTGEEAGFYQPGAVINPTESISLYAMWDTTTQHTATVNTYLDGVLTNDTDIHGEDRDLYLSTDEVHYYKLTKTSTGVYTVNITGNGKFHLYYKEADGTYTQIGNNQLTIYNQNGSMDVHHYSVSYDPNGGAFATAQQPHNYGYGETVKAITDIPTRDGYRFLGWNDGNGNIIQPRGIVTESITSKTVLTAKWEKNVSVTINVTINHEGGDGHDPETTKDDVTLELASRENSSHPYLETGHVLKLNNEEHNGFSYAPVYGDDNTEAEVKMTHYSSNGATYKDLPGGDVEYTVVASKSGYDTKITPTKDADGNWVIDVVMTYNPSYFDLEFTATVDESVPEKYLPTGAIVKVSYWSAEDFKWKIITQQDGNVPGVRVNINSETRKGTGSYPVWRYTPETNDPYGYRLVVSSFIYPDGTIVEASDIVKDISWTDGAYVATMDDVSDGQKCGNLYGSYFAKDSDAQQGTLNVNITLDLYDVIFDAKGGKINGFDKQTVTEQLRIPAFADYVPVRDDGYIFAGWYTDEACTVAAVEGTALSDNTTLYAKWIEPLTISGTVTVDGTYLLDGKIVSVNEADRAIEAGIVLQEVRNGYVYDIDSKIVTFGTYGDNGSADYSFAGIPNEGKSYQVRVLVLNYTTTYDNESDEGTSYTSDEYTVVFGSDNIADVDAYLEFEPSAYDQILNVDATAIGEGFRPSNVLSEVMYRDTGDNKPYNCISQHTVRPYGVVIGLTDGIGKNTQSVWQWHTNGTLYDYQMNVTAVDEKTYNSDTAPFDIVYDAPAYWDEKTGKNSSELKATLTPKIYAVNFDFNADGDTVKGMDSYLQEDGSYLSQHKWSYDTKIEAKPEREGYVFLGWEATEEGTFDAQTQTVHSSVAEDITLKAKWGQFKWVTDTDSGYFNTDNGKKSVVRFLFDVETTDELKQKITKTGIKFIKSDDIGDKVDNNEVVGEDLTGSMTTFYGDIVDIPVDKDGTEYFAIAYVICGDKTFWSLPVACGPDFGDLIIYE